MANMIIKPAADGNLLIQDRAGGAVLSTSTSGATIANATLTTPTIASMANCTFPAGHVVQTVFNTYNAQNSDVTNSTTFARVSKDSVYHWKGQIDNVGENNHVLIHMTFGFSLSKTAVNVGAGFGVFRGSFRKCPSHTRRQYSTSSVRTHLRGRSFHNAACSGDVGGQCRTDCSVGQCFSKA